MQKLLVVVDAATKGEALAVQAEEDLDLLVISSPPLRASWLPPDDPLQRRRPRFEFAPLPAARNTLDRLLDHPGNEIYLAFDCDQRGEYLSWMLSQHLASATGGAKVPRRLHFLALHQDEIREAFRLVKPVDEERAVTCHVRTLFNALLIKHLERLLGTRKGPGGLPLTIASLAVLFVLTEREAEIRAYTPALKWQIQVKLATAQGRCAGRLIYAHGFTDDGFLRRTEQNQEVIALFQDEPMLVRKLHRTPLTLDPPLPYRLADLLQDAMLRYDIPPRQTLDLVRQLFRGVPVEGRACGLISTFDQLASPLDTLIVRLRAVVERRMGGEALGSADTVTPGEGFLLPTRPDVEPQTVAQALDDAAASVYGLIRDRALASQLRPAAGHTVEAELQAGEHCYFKASGRTVDAPGYLALFQGEGERELLKPSALAGLQEGDRLTVEQIVPSQTSGFPPVYHTFESLFAELTDFGIEPDAALVQTLQAMLDADYFAVTPEGEIRCRQNAIKVVATLNRAFPTMLGINLSAYIEQVINEVASGRKPYDFGLRQFEQTLIMQGKVLVKFGVAPQPRPRSNRTSRRIIKAPEAPAATLPGKSAAAPADRGVPPAPEAAPSPPPAAEAPLPPEIAGGEGGPEAAAVVDSSGEVLSKAITAVEGIGAARDEAEAAPEEPASSVAETEEAALAEEEAGWRQGEEEPQEVAEAVGSQPAASAPAAAGEGEEIFEAPAEGPPAEAAVEAAAETPPPEAGEEAAAGAEAAMACPLCEVGRVVSKLTPTGRPFFICPEPTCEFMAWSQPHAVACPVCESPFLVEKKTVSGRTFLRCPRAGCQYRQALPGEDGSFLESERPRKKVVVRRRKGSPGTIGRKRKVVVRRRS